MKGKLTILCLLVLVLASFSALAQHQENLTTTLDLYVAPTVSNVLVDDADSSIANEIDLTPGSTTSVWCYAEIEDADGESDINASWAYLYLSSGDYTDADDPQNHYTNSSCVIDTSFGTANQASVNCTFPSVEFYAVNGSWKCSMFANDSVALSSGPINDTTNVNNLLALDVADGALDFGKLAIGTDTGTSDTAKTVTNNGNTDLGIKLNVWGSILNDGHSMDCTSGYLVPGDIRVHHTASIAYASKTPLASTNDDGTEYSDLYKILRQTSGTTGSTDDLYFGAGVSSTGSPTGTCSGNLMFTGLVK